MDLIKKQFLQWHSNIEKKIPCHFCGTTLSEKIFSCSSGHDSCFSCKTESCIACPNSNLFFRNHIAELLISQFNNLKKFAEQLDISAIDKKNDNKNSTKVNKATEAKIQSHNKMSMVTEKDINNFSESKPAINSSVNGSIQVCDGKLKIQANPTLSNTVNFYSCWIGTCCFRGIYENILEHMKSSHSSVFTSHLLKGWPHVMNWDLIYSGPDSRQDYAFELQGIGLFILHISVSHKENMKAHVLMFDSGKIAAQYGYNIEIKCDDKQKSFNAVVDSSRMPRKILQDCTKGLFISENSLLLNTIKLRQNFKCILEINTLNKSICNGISTFNLAVRNVDVENKPNAVQKPRPLNKPHFKPRKNFNKTQNKSGIPALLDIKLPNSPATQVQPAPQSAPDSQLLMNLIQQFLANVEKTPSTVQNLQVQQVPPATNSSTILQPSSQQMQVKNPQNIVVDQQTRAVTNQATVPTPSPVPQIDDLLIFDDSSKSDESTLNNLKVQNSSPANVEESEETEQPEESDSKPNNDCKVN